MGRFTRRIMEWSEEGREEQRRCGRIRVELIKSNLGSIIDMSATGLRIHRRSFFKPKLGRTTVVMKTLEGTITIPSRIVRVRGVGSRRWEIGVQFDEVSEEVRSTIMGIARTSGARREIEPTLPGCNQRKSA